MTDNNTPGTFPAAEGQNGEDATGTTPAQNTAADQALTPQSPATNPTLELHELWNQRHASGAAAETAAVPLPDAAAPAVPLPDAAAPTAALPAATAPATAAEAPSAAAEPDFAPVEPTAPAAGAPVPPSSYPTAPIPAPQPRYGQYAQSSHSAGHGAHYGAPQQPATQQYPGQQPGPHPMYQGQHPAYQGALPPAVKTPGKRRFGTGVLVASVLAAALVGGGVAGTTSYFLASQNTSSSATQAPQSSSVIVNNKDNVNAVTAAAQKASPSVVTISASSGQSGGTGSGIILDTEGHILTNTHVVTLDGQAANATIEVQTSDGKVYKGTIVGTDPLSDLAIIKVDAPNLVPAALGDSGKINVGDTVIAIGAPLGLSGTVTDGIVSTLNRTIQVASSAVPGSSSDSSQQGGRGGNGFNFAPPDGSNSTNSAATGTVNLNVIQTDAAINPGNSGGALVNTAGEIIGVNVAIASAGSSSSSAQSGNIGVGFSIPIDTAKRIAQEIIANGKATHGQLGVSVQAAAANGTSSSFSNGASLATVPADSPADKAGLKKGDVIVQLGSRTITDASELTAAVREQAGGATVKVTFVRDGKTQSADVTLGTAS
ncbi:trypsin-like peptidase domain-containing protein [Pseudarthrobacter sp. P1]|uniref:S1C family serine protease n=1 Tax=Pseudarthrobacter sp. P1 TaxID=3418418 RepID=UPI003CFA2865